ncbi:ribonuclease H-like domain-containing protein [Tanacetum coccineum]
MIDYARMISPSENEGNTAPKTTVVEGVEKVMPPTTVEEKAQKRLERFGGDAATKKTQRAPKKSRCAHYMNKEITDKTVPMETSTSPSYCHVMVLVGMTGVIRAEDSDLSMHSCLLISKISDHQRKKLEIAKIEKDGIQFNVDKLENASKSLNKLIESQIIDNCKKGLGYNAVPPPHTGNFMPPTPDLYFTGLDEFVNKPVVENRKSDEEVSKVVRKSNDFPIIKDWVSDIEEENVSQTKTEKKTLKPSIAKIEFVKPKQQEKTTRKTVKQVKKHRQNTYSTDGNHKDIKQ